MTSAKPAKVLGRMLTLDLEAKLRVLGYIFCPRNAYMVGTYLQPTGNNICS